MTVYVKIEKNRYVTVEVNAFLDDDGSTGYSIRVPREDDNGTVLTAEEVFSIEDAAFELWDQQTSQSY